MQALADADDVVNKSALSSRSWRLFLLSSLSFFSFFFFSFGLLEATRPQVKLMRVDVP